MKKILLASICACISVTSIASTDFYAGLNAGVSTVPNYNGAYNANAGYMLGDYLGLEGGYTWNQENNFWDAAVKVVLPIPIVDIYGKVGYAFIDGTQFNADSGILYGAGIGIPILPYFRLNIEDYAISSLTTQNFVMAGLQFNF